MRNVSISRLAFGAFNMLVDDFAYKLGRNCERLLQRPRSTTKRVPKATLTALDVQWATKMTLDGVIDNDTVRNNAFLSGQEAVERYKATKPVPVPKAPVDPNAPPSAKISTIRGQNKTERAKTNFPVGRVLQRFKSQRIARYYSPESAVFAAAVFDEVFSYLMSDCILATIERLRFKPTAVGAQMRPEHVMRAVKGDPVFATLFSGHVFKGGVIPHIQPALFPPKQRKRAFELIDAQDAAKKEVLSQKGSARTLARSSKNANRLPSSKKKKQSSRKSPVTKRARVSEPGEAPFVPLNPKAAVKSKAKPKRVSAAATVPAVGAAPGDLVVVAPIDSPAPMATEE